MDSLKGTLTPIKVLNGTLNGGIAYGTFNYNELENKPSVNGTELVGNVNIAIPTKTSDLTNDSGFITDADVPTKTSDLTNDSGFITSEDIPTIPTNTSQLNNDSGFLTMLTTPVKSVNSQTGDVNLFIPNATSQLNNDAGFITESNIPVQSVNGQTGEVELTSEDISYDGGTETTKQKIEAKQNKIKRKSVPVSLGTATYSDFLYADVAVNDVPKENIIGMYISGNPTNRPAFAILLDGNATKIRLFANSYSQNSTFNVILTYFE